MSHFLAWIGRFSARHRILVTTVWVLVLGALAAIVIANPATPESGAVSMPDTQASEALDVVQEEFPELAVGSAETLQLVFQAPAGASVTDPAIASAIGDVLAEARQLDTVTAVIDPLDVQTRFVSEDQSLAVATLQFDGLAEDDEKPTYDEVVDLAESAPDDLRVEVGGAQSDIEAPPAGVGEAVGVLVAFLVLLLTFGSMLAAGANMLVAFTGVGIGALGVLAYGTINPIQPTTLTLGTMLGLAVGIDYSLFILTRFRAELREGRRVDDAIARAVGTAGTAVVFAGLTVIIALVGLGVVQISFITEMGIAGAFGVLVAVLVALTLLPVLLRTLGTRVLPRRERRALAGAAAMPQAGPTDQARPAKYAKSGFLQKWAGLIVKHPVLAMFSGVAVLGVVAAPVLGMQTAANVPGGVDPVSTQRAAYNLVLDEFGGVQSPLIVLVQGEDIADRLPDVEQELSRVDGAMRVLPGTVNANGDAGLITVIPEGGPIDDETKNLVRDIRADADAFDGVHLEVTGETAIGIDSDAVLNQALVTYLIVIVALSLALLVLMFRSLLIPLMATLGFLLTVGASFGASVAVFQWGWLDPLIAAPQGDPMLSILPIILVGVLFGLAMDYQVFLVSRIQEMHSKGLNPKDAIVSGFSKSAPVLVAAAAIMATVFAGFATSPMAVAASIAVGLVVGVVADAFIVRMLLMPAVLALLGPSAWWLPRWLDRILPNLDIEGHALDRAEAEAQALRPASVMDSADQEPETEREPALTR